MTILSVHPHYSMIPADDFAADFPKAAIVGINLNQTSPAELLSSAPWAIGLGQKALSRGREVLWSVPFPGARRLEEVNSGQHDDLYRQITDQLLKAVPGTGRILVRLPWEFNLRMNTENLFVDRAGKSNHSLGLLAWRRIAGLFRSRSPRFQLVWSPSIEHPSASVVDPVKAWPGVEFVDIIAPDLYVARAFGHKPGDYVGGWFRAPLLALRAFAYEKGKPFGLAETGTDSDDFAADVAMWLTDVASAPSGCAFISWWNDWQVVDCRITGGRLPKIAAAVAKL